MKKRIFAALLCVIMLFGMLPITALAAEPKTIYVDATEGNDKNNGSKDLPYATVEKAVTEAEMETPSSSARATTHFTVFPAPDTPRGKI